MVLDSAGEWRTVPGFQLDSGLEVRVVHGIGVDLAYEIPRPGFRAVLLDQEWQHGNPITQCRRPDVAGVRVPQPRDDRAYRPI